MNWTPKQLAFAAACKQFGPLVGPLPDSIEGAQLLWAIGGNESSFGENTSPRHEPAYDVGGIYADSNAENLEKYGSIAACSLGPLQIMFPNAPQGVTPDEFDDPETAVQYSVGFLNAQLNRFKPTSLEQIGQIWNAGHPLKTMSAGVAVYCTKLQGNYAIPIPEAQ